MDKCLPGEHRGRFYVLYSFLATPKLTPVNLQICLIDNPFSLKVFIYLLTRYVSQGIITVIISIAVLSYSVNKITGCIKMLYKEIIGIPRGYTAVMAQIDFIIGI